jgi:hypothetical protein
MSASMELVQSESAKAAYASSGSFLTCLPAGKPLLFEAPVMRIMGHSLVCRLFSAPPRRFPLVRSRCVSFSRISLK